MDVVIFLWVFLHSLVGFLHMVKQYLFPDATSDEFFGMVSNG